jgi:hypothetical protein
MSHNGLKSLSEQIFRPDSPLQALARRAGAAAELTVALRGALPPDLATALRSASIADDGTLVVTTTSPVWASRLRFEADALLAACRVQHPATERIKVRVGPPKE